MDSLLKMESCLLIKKSFKILEKFEQSLRRVSSSRFQAALKGFEGGDIDNRVGSGVCLWSLKRSLGKFMEGLRKFQEYSRSGKRNN